MMLFIRIIAISFKQYYLKIYTLNGKLENIERMLKSRDIDSKIYFFILINIMFS